MSWLVASLAVFFGGALACLGTVGRPRLARLAGPAVAVGGSLLGLGAAGGALFSGAPTAAQCSWRLPVGAVALALDPLSALFAVPILVLTALAAVYGSGYLEYHVLAGHHAASADGGALGGQAAGAAPSPRDLAASWFWYNVLTGSMLLAVLAANAMLFLLAWEVMSLASFFLVTFEHDEPGSRHAGWVYLVATHVGTAFLLVMFALLGRQAGALDFAAFAQLALPPTMAATVFLLAMVGFGTKAGFVPLHVWLPEAHPAAPSHVSAVMSGVMIKTGIYGLLRTLTFVGSPPPWWGWSLVGVGVVSGVLGVLFALAQHDLKRLLAYSSVENIGIITLGLGVGVLGVSYHQPVLAFLGLGGGLLHVLNHAAFKGLLFLSGGAAVQRAGSRQLDRLGGLLRRMPVTGAVFVVGSVAICGLPPFNGFVSELLIYLASLLALAGRPHLPPGAALAGLAAVGGLALIGGLAVACFCRVGGVVFLGEPRCAEAVPPNEINRAMRWPMLILAGLCLAMGLGAPLLLGGLGRAAGLVAGSALDLRVGVAWATGPLWISSAVVGGLCLLLAALLLARALVLRGRPVTAAVTWDCGYAAPTARMQYTASSFGDPLTRLFGIILRTRRRIVLPDGLFPRSASYTSETPDVYREQLYRPGFASLEALLARFRWLQHGRLNLYVLSVVAALLVALAWGMR